MFSRTAFAFFLPLQGPFRATVTTAVRGTATMAAMTLLITGVRPSVLQLRLRSRILVQDHSQGENVRCSKPSL
jgi:hypothetical protein